MSKKNNSSVPVMPNCPTPEIKVEDDRTGMSLETLKRAFLDNLFYIQGVDQSNATKYN